MKKDQSDEIQEAFFVFDPSYFNHFIVRCFLWTDGNGNETGIIRHLKCPLGGHDVMAVGSVARDEADVRDEGSAFRGAPGDVHGGGREGCYLNISVVRFKNKGRKRSYALSFKPLIFFFSIKVR